MEAESKRQVTIINRLGLHARPAAMLVKVAAGFRAHVFLSRDGHEVNGKSIMGVMMLAAEQGTELVVRADGEDANQATQAVAELIASGFGED